MNFPDIVMARYATKSFDGREIPTADFERLLELIRFAPTSFNLQTWRALIVKDAARKEAVQKAAWNQPQVTTCSHLLVFCANTQLELLADRLEERMLAAGVPTPQVSGFLGMVRGWIENLGEGRTAWAQRQCYLSLANGLHGAKALGFDSCPMEGFDPAGVAAALGLPAHLTPTVMMPIGYAADTPRAKLRFTREEMFFEQV